MVPLLDDAGPRGDAFRWDRALRLPITFPLSLYGNDLSSLTHKCISNTVFAITNYALVERNHVAQVANHRKPASIERPSLAKNPRLGKFQSSRIAENGSLAYRYSCLLAFSAFGQSTYLA